jgi:hypothetical protein
MSSASCWAIPSQGAARLMAGSNWAKHWDPTASRGLFNTPSKPAVSTSFQKAAESLAFGFVILLHQALSPRTRHSRPCPKSSPAKTFKALFYAESRQPTSGLCRVNGLTWDACKEMFGKKPLLNCQCRPDKSRY